MNLIKHGGFMKKGLSLGILSVSALLFPNCRFINNSLDPLKSTTNLNQNNTDVKFAFDGSPMPSNIPSTSPSPMAIDCDELPNPDNLPSGTICKKITKCTESDGGDKPKDAGYDTVEHDDGSSKTYIDNCTNGNNLYEGSCSGKTGYQRIAYDCNLKFKLQCVTKKITVDGKEKDAGYCGTSTSPTPDVSMPPPPSPTDFQTPDVSIAPSDDPTPDVSPMMP